MPNNVLDVKNLHMNYETIDGWVSAVQDVSFKIKKGESFGLVGESGCGKTSVAMSLMKLQSDNGFIDSGEILIDGKDVVPLSEKELREVRWKDISIVFQGAMNAWNPVIKVGEQIREALREHYPDNSKDQNYDKMSSLFQLVGLESSVLERYPHELSGGMKQRAVIALALSCDPKLIIADEPTTALDVVIQDQILNELKSIQDKLGLSILYISHDISVIAEMTENMAVMYAGRIIEMGPTKEIFKKPLHSYTRLLLESTPSVVGKKKKLDSMDGEPPSLMGGIDGCSFSPRCPKPTSKCKSRSIEMGLIEINKGHWVDQCCVHCG